MRGRMINKHCLIRVRIPFPVKQLNIWHKKRTLPAFVPSIMIYNEWVRENAVKGEQYIWVYNEDKIRGLRFHRLVKLFKYWTINIDRILRFIIIDPQDVEIQ
jgi:hypothetical protein